MMQLMLTFNLQLFTADLMQPGMPATFHRTTAAKKISTKSKNQVNFLVCGIGYILIKVSLS